MSGEAIETETVPSARVACDGGKGALGHPRIYLNMGDKQSVDCPYCGKRFVLADGAGADSGH